MQKDGDPERVSEAQNKKGGAETPKRGECRVLGVGGVPRGKIRHPGKEGKRLGGSTETQRAEWEGTCKDPERQENRDLPREDRDPETVRQRLRRDTQRSQSEGGKETPPDPA